MDWIIQHINLVTTIVLILVVVIYKFATSPSNKSENKTQTPIRQEKEMEETAKITAEFTFTDGTTRRFTCTKIDTNDNYWELSDEDKNGEERIVAEIPFMNVKYVDYP